MLSSAVRKSPAVVLIDAPDTHLHPTLQLAFLARLAEYASTGIVLFSTHSIGLARMISAQTYSVRGAPGAPSQVTEYERTPRLSEFLGQVSYAGYREVGIKTVLLVEGTSDVAAARQFLRKLGREATLLVLPLGGDALINGRQETVEQLEEAKRIVDEGGAVYALIDSELSEAGAKLHANRAAFSAACEDAGIGCHVLRRRALENYFPDRAVKSALGNAFSGLGPYERFGEAGRKWSKHDDWRIAKEMTADELDATDDLVSFFRSI